MLLELQKRFPSDQELLMAIGNSLLDTKDPARAAKVFESAIALRHDDPALEDAAGAAWLAAEDSRAAARHFERALELDPLLLPDIEALRQIYRDWGDEAKERALMERVRAAMQTPAGKTAGR
jgi:tetratricopeptide (TPR) repeat protein